MILTCWLPDENLRVIGLRVYCRQYLQAVTERSIDLHYALIGLLQPNNSSLDYSIVYLQVLI